MTDEIDDLIGDTPAEGKKRGRPTNEEAARRRSMSNPGDWRATKGGVTRAWLCAAFGRDDRTVKALLVNCPVLRVEGRSEYYDFVEAARFLSKPSPEAIAAFFKNVKVSELPTYLQDQYWSAQRKRQIWEENAGHLWRTEAVLDVFGETFTALKTVLQLWVDNLDRQAPGMSDHQRATLQSYVDELQNDMHSALLEIPKSRSTPSQLESGEVLTEDSPQFATVDDDEDLVG